MEPEASPVRRTTSTRISRANYASLPHRSVSHTHTLTRTNTCQHIRPLWYTPDIFPQERQSIIKYWMENLRAKQGEVLHNINFLEGQPISELHLLFSHYSTTVTFLIFPTTATCMNLCLNAVPELSARGVIQQVFPLHEQRILGQLMKSWVQAVCEKQPLGQQD